MLRGSRCTVVAAATASVWLSVSCAGRPAGGGRLDAAVTDGGALVDATAITDASVVIVPADLGGSSDASVDFGATNECFASCGPVELCGPSGEGNGLDDNCNGHIDETCLCPGPSVTQACFGGRPEQRSTGACVEGVMHCGEFNQWSTCIGSVLPAAEICDGLDNDCNGIVDDGLVGCDSTFHCPGNDVARPLQHYELRGARVFGGAASSWQWAVDCPPQVSSCPAPEATAEENTQVYFAQSGRYQITASFLPEGETEPVMCRWLVNVTGPGLRVELDWNTLRSGGVDMDLHLHRWTRDGVDTDWDSRDDCYFGNCRASALTPIDWSPSHETSPIEHCVDAPLGAGARWEALGYCRNPRLDVDMNRGSSPSSRCIASVTDPNDPKYCAPENINVDVPVLGHPYRIMAHQYAGTQATYSAVSVYCNGTLRATFGTDPLVMTRYNQQWLVADVVFEDGPCGLDCRIFPLGEVRGGLFPNDHFGPPWSCSPSVEESRCR